MAVVAAVLIVAILVTGTFAWQSIGQRAINQAISVPRPAGGRLHNNFQVMGPNFGEAQGDLSNREYQWRAGVTADKGVYIENFERIDNNGRDIFLRVRLYEYMEIGYGARLHPGDPDFDDRAAESILPGADRVDFTTWRRRIPGADPGGSDLFRHYWDWHLGGWKYFIPTFNRDPYSRETDVKGAAFDPQDLNPGELPSSTHRDESHEFPLTAGREEFWAYGRYHYGRIKYWDATYNLGTGRHSIATYPTRHYARRTLGAEIMLMADWMAAGSPVGNFWVWDVDGWFYWARPLPAEQATGLILNSITLRTNPSDQWFYAIFIDAEMAVSNEWYADAPGEGWFHDPERAPTADATALLNRITGRAV